jgi:hypothetical protein
VSALIHLLLLDYHHQVSISVPIALLSLSPDHKTHEDQLLLLLDQQLHGVNSSLLVCKWPIILTSCFFMTLLGWDMAGDQSGWFHALWVPIVGVAMAMVLWVWDWVLISGKIPADRLSFSLPPSKCHSDPTAALSPEFIRSSLHEPPPTASGLELPQLLDEETSTSSLRSSS